jgi:hypothetical protein
VPVKGAASDGLTPVHFSSGRQSCATVSQTGGQRSGSVQGGSPVVGSRAVVLVPVVPVSRAVVPVVLAVVVLASVVVVGASVVLASCGVVVDESARALSDGAQASGARSSSERARVTARV